VPLGVAWKSSQNVLSGSESRPIARVAQAPCDVATAVAIGIGGKVEGGLVLGDPDCPHAASRLAAAAAAAICITRRPRTVRVARVNRLGAFTSGWPTAPARSAGM
jgi:hypothetical protein